MKKSEGITSGEYMEETRRNFQKSSKGTTVELMDQIQRNYVRKSGRIDGTTLE